MTVQILHEGKVSNEFEWPTVLSEDEPLAKVEDEIDALEVGEEFDMGDSYKIKRVN